MSDIVVENAVKSWGASRAVDGVTFSADAGSMVVLLGPSGCGKSTTLRLIAGLETADSGRISIGGRDVTGLPPAARGLSMVFQSYALFPHLSVADNILFGLQVRGVDKTERRRRLDRAADLLGLEKLLHRRPSQLSGGQQQRVALGRAIVAETPVCLMDEPLSNLDAQLRHEMRKEIRALQRKLGVTMLYVTHDQTEAMTMADRVILLRDGRIEQNATPEDMYARPTTAFAAAFVGTPPMNLIRGAESTLGVRPEDIRFVHDGGRTVVVEGIEYLGAESIVAVALDGQPVNVRAPGRSDLTPGQEARIAWPQEAEHRFDATGGRRIETAAHVSPRTAFVRR